MLHSYHIEETTGKHIFTYNGEGNIGRVLHLVKKRILDGDFFYPFGIVILSSSKDSNKRILDSKTDIARIMGKGIDEIPIAHASAISHSLESNFEGLGEFFRKEINLYSK